MERPDDTLHDEDFNDEAKADETEGFAVPDPEEREESLPPEEEELEPVPDDPADAAA